MSTRGCYGFRKNGVDKLAYNGHDSYPGWLGANVVDFCSNTSIAEMNALFEKIIMVEQDAMPTAEQAEECRVYLDVTASTQLRGCDWYCLLEDVEGNLNVYKQGLRYMPNANYFIKDSLFCEHAYIINLDSGKLEHWRGFQLVHEFDLTAIPENAVEIMEVVK